MDRIQAYEMWNPGIEMEFTVYHNVMEFGKFWKKNK